MSNITLSEFLGWEDEQLYEYEGFILRILSNKLLVAIDYGKKEYVEWGFSELKINEICELKKANKLDVPRYYLKHKNSIGYLNYDFNGNSMISKKEGLGNFVTKFRKCDIDEMYSRGINIGIFEKIIVED